MLNLLMQQVMALLKANGFDGEQAQAQVKQAVDDIRAMKESQDRCEAMLKALLTIHGRSIRENVLGHEETVQ